MIRNNICWKWSRWFTSWPLIPLKRYTRLFLTFTISLDLGLRLFIRLSSRLFLNYCLNRKNILNQLSRFFIDLRFIGNLRFYYHIHSDFWVIRIISVIFLVIWWFVVWFLILSFDWFSWWVMILEILLFFWRFVLILFTLHL